MAVSGQHLRPEIKAEIIRRIAAGEVPAHVARDMGAGRGTVFRYAREWREKRDAERGKLGFAPVLPGYEIKETSTQFDGDGNVERQWVQQHKERGDPFELPAGHVIKGVSALTDPDGRVIQQWVKTKEGLSPADTVAAIKEAFAGFELRAPVIDPPTATDEETATIYIAADFHVGLLSWKDETGENWDLKIAEKTIGGAVERLVSTSPASKQAVVLVLGDLLHADGYDNATRQSKHVLDVDGRHPKRLQTATRLIIRKIRLALTKHETVLVRILAGNHDPESAVAVALALALYFENDPRVVVDDDPSYFWWWSWGNTLLGATHGDAAKMKDLPLIMATRNPEAWGKAKFRHVYTGHIHTQTGIEISGVTVESFQTPVPADAWHNRMGYKAGRSLTSITLHREHGEISRQKVNIV